MLGFLLDISRFVVPLLVVDFLGYSHGVCIFCGVGADETLVGLELEYRNVIDLGQVVCIIVRLLSLVR